MQGGDGDGDGGGDGDTPVLANCPGTQFESAPATATTQAVCTDLTICTAGQQVSVRPGLTSDRVCAPCPEETFSEIENADACIAWTQCQFRDVQVPGSATSDRTCAPGWVHQFGEADDDWATALDLDGSGNVFVSGSTDTAVGDVANAGLSDAFVTKLSGTDGSRVWTQQLGSDGHDGATDTVVDSAGNVVVSGSAGGDLLGMGNAGAADGFVAKLSGDDGRILWLRLFGTPESDVAQSVAIDGNDDILVVGNTGGDLDGTSAGGLDAFAMGLSGADGRTLWVRQFGTAGTDVARSVALAASGAAFVAGLTDGALGAGALGDVDAFVTRVSTADGSEQWTRQFGSAQRDIATTIAVDEQGDPIVAGETGGMVGGEGHAGEDDAFVKKLSGADGADLWTRQIGTPGPEMARGLRVDVGGDVFFAGATTGDFGDADNAGMLDAVVLSLSGDDGSTQWIRQFGTAGDDWASAVGLDGSGGVFIAGATDGTLDTGAEASDRDAFAAMVTTD